MMGRRAQIFCQKFNEGTSFLREANADNQQLKSISGCPMQHPQTVRNNLPKYKTLNGTPIEGYRPSVPLRIPNPDC